MIKKASDLHPADIGHAVEVWAHGGGKSCGEMIRYRQVGDNVFVKFKGLTETVRIALNSNVTVSTLKVRNHAG